jgi:uncharacterized Zn-binding protein involved in type VI secretion
MKALSKTLGFAVAATAIFTAFAAAATLSLGSKSLSAGSATVSSCGVSSLSATRNVDNAGNVTQVNVSGIPAACAGETLSVTLVGSSGAGLASLSTTVSGATATFGGISGVDAGTLASYAFAVEGA